MTREAQELIDAELTAAIDSGDQARIAVATAHAVKALTDCQLKTGERVKALVANEARREAEIEGMRKLGRLLNVGYTLLGGGGVYALCKAAEALSR